MIFTEKIEKRINLTAIIKIYSIKNAREIPSLKTYLTSII
jgi:hypothetical protein